MRNASCELFHFSDCFFEPGERVIELSGKIVQFVVGTTYGQPPIQTGNRDFASGSGQSGDRLEGLSRHPPGGDSRKQDTRWNKPSERPKESVHGVFHWLHGRANEKQICVTEIASHNDLISKAKSALIGV